MYEKNYYMKKIFIALFAALSLGSFNANADITDLLKGLGSAAGSEGAQSTAASGLEGLVKGLLSNSKITEKDLVGSWKYSGPAVAFQGGNFLEKAGGAAAAGVIADKIAPYYKKVGIDKMTCVFNDDKTFTFKVGRVTLKGTVEVVNAKNPDGSFWFNFTVGKIPVGKMKGHVEKQINTMTLTFDASKLITLVTTIAKVSGQSSLQAMSKLLNQYDGLNCGFELAKTK